MTAPERFVNFDTGTPVALQDATQTFSGGASGPGIQISPLASSLNKGLSITQNTAGTIASTINYNIINITDAAAVTGFQFANGLNVTISANSGSVQGGRQSIIGNMFLQATSSASSSNREYVGVVGIGQSNVNDNGTNPAAAATSAGAVFGGNFEGVLGVAGATAFLNVTGAEFNSRITTGASAWAKTLAQFSSDAFDRVQGTVIDTMLWLYNQNDPSIPGWNTGILFDDSGGTGFWPIKSTGTIIKTGGGGTAATGIDFSNTTLTTLIKGANFSIPGGALTQVAAPGNANAAAAGVPVGGVYTSTADPHVLYVRTV
jgi:hypothetical protein